MVLDENGNPTKNRKISPKEWNEVYKSKHVFESKFIDTKEVNKINNPFKKPNLFKQFNVFSSRNLLSKLSNKQYLYITFLEAPILALLLAYLVKYYHSEGEYIFAENKNIPAYLFISVLVALFVGLTVSAEEIIRDRKLLKRESFLNLSKGSYLTSKILILFLISAIQTLTFVVIGNTILEIKGMYLDYWLVLFTTACFANMLGLNISASFNSAVTIYVLIPFLLIPQILLSGVIVKFEELNPQISSNSVVPLWGDVMASRWAFEALAVNQFINNKYEKEIYSFEKEISNAGFKQADWCSKMNELARECSNENPNETNLNILINELEKEQKATPQIPFAQLNNLELNETAVKPIQNYLSKIREYYRKKYNDAVNKKDEWLNKFQKIESEKKQFVNLINYNQNNKLEEFVKNISTDLDAIVEENEKLIATTNPIFRDGTEEYFIRAHFFAPTKSINGKLYSTYWVNILVLWAMIVFLWISLYFDGLKKLMSIPLVRIIKHRFSK